ncbi:GNAT family N-acetyltransferase [Pantoea sp. C2G6]|uniref:GNAT family N-acetyltransferase n=1 Tax=Pantoea sp. C2G6 TaxID=3243084 RepID=UPI003ED94340
MRIQTLNGYELVGAFENEKMLGLMGFRPVHTLARGFHLHIDDLVVDEALRSSGIGKALLDFATSESKSREMKVVFLDARPEAIPFYERNDFIHHTSPSMKKPIS